MEALLDEAGVPQPANEYFQARGIALPSTLAFIANEETELASKVIDRLVAGHTIQGKLRKYDQDADVLRATVLVAWHLSRRASAAYLPPPPSLSPPPGLPPPTTTSKTKPPNSLEAGVWARQIKKYNDQLVDNMVRKFPETQILGAEAILARLLFELQVSRLFTPLRLGEILTARSFTSTGEANRLAQDRKDRVLQGKTAS